MLQKSLQHAHELFDGATLVDSLMYGAVLALCS
jgi:hypothetical protein